MKRLAAAIAFATATLSAHAQFVTSDGAFGAGSLVTDTVSGVTWLNLNETLGLSFNQVVFNLALDPIYADFRLSTQNELTQLFTDAGFCINLPTCVDTAARAASRDSFRSTFEDDGSGNYIGINPGMIGIINPAQGIYQTFRTFIGGSVASLDFTGDASTIGHANTGTWLVSRSAVTPVPEPQTYALMLAGFAAVGFLLHRRGKAEG